MLRIIEVVFLAVLFQLVSAQTKVACLAGDNWCSNTAGTVPLNYVIVIMCVVVFIVYVVRHNRKVCVWAML